MGVFVRLSPCGGVCPPSGCPNLATSPLGFMSPVSDFAGGVHSSANPASVQPGPAPTRATSLRVNTLCPADYRQIFGTAPPSFPHLTLRASLGTSDGPL